MLEVHTIVHVVCALALYALWYEKPLSVETPTLVEFKGTDKKFLAFILELGAEQGDHSMALHPEARWFNAAPSDHCGFEVYDSELPKSGKCKYEEPRMVVYQEALSKHLNSEQINGTDCIDILQAPKLDITAPCHRLFSRDKIVHYTWSEKELKILPESCIARKPPLEYFPAANTHVVCTLSTGESLNSGCGPGLDHRSGKLKHKVNHDSRTIRVGLSSKDVKRLILAAAYMKTSPAPPKEGSPKNKPHKTKTFFNEEVEKASTSIYKFAQGSQPLLALRSQNMNGSYFKGIENEGDETYLSAAMALVPAIYGSAHIGALSILFPSAIERLLWKISCYYLVGSSISFGLWSLLRYGDVRIARVFQMQNTPLDLWDGFRLRYPYKFQGRVRRVVIACFSFFHYVRSGLFGILALAYVSARMYLVVESFISLRYVPVGIYQTPAFDIMGKIPHL